MAAAPPPMPTQPTPMQTDPAGSVPPISWEGDKMFNIYIYDYCNKRGFRRTAKELLQEAEISADATPPINARQGLLFEWWSVFWVLFQAKSNGGGSEDGLVYINNQSAQRQQAQQAQRGHVNAAPLPLGGQTSQPPLQQQPQQPQAMARLPNGMPPGNMQSAMTRPYMPNGAMTNGVSMNPAIGGQPQPQQGQPMPPSMNFGGMGVHPPPQPNGMPNSGPGPGGPPPPQQQQQGVSTQPMTFTMMPNQQRPPSMMNGIPPQQRGPPNGALFQGSPTMANSPQHNAGAPGHHGQPQQPGQSQQGGPGQQAPMAQLGGPSPHIRPGGMLPPNGGPPNMGPMNPGQPQLQQGPPTPGYQQQQQQQHNTGGRPPSRTNTPRSGMMSHASPSLAARQTTSVPGGPPGMGPGGQGQGMMNMGSSGISGMVGGVNSEQMNHEIMQIPQNSLNALKQELGFGDKDMSNLGTTEKSRIISTWRQRNGGPLRKDVPGPSGTMQAPGQPGQQSQRPGQPPQQRIKRNSTSPGEEHESLPGNESSPPDRKRPRRSPAEQPAMTPISYAQHQGPPPPGQQQQLGQPPNQAPLSVQQHQQQMNMLIQQRQMAGMNGMHMGVGGPGGPPPPQQQQQQQQHPGVQQPPLGPPGGLGAPMMQMGGGNVMMSPQQQQMHANQQQQQPQQLYRIANNQGPPPSGSAPQFTSPLNNRMQNKPMSGMMPPPSPAINGPPKDTNKDANNANNKGPGGGLPPPPNGQQQQQQPTHNPDGSPRNQPPGGPSGSGTAPVTPIPSNQPNPQQSQQQQQQPPPPNHLNMMSSASLLGMPPSAGGMGPDMNLFDPGAFMDGMGTDFDPSTLFRPDGDINFERDFGQWFNPDDAPLGASLDMK